MFLPTPSKPGSPGCAAEGCAEEGVESCPTCRLPVCGGHYWSAADEHGCKEMPRGVEGDYPAGEELKIGRTRYRVISRVVPDEEGEGYTLIVEPVYAVAFHYEVKVSEGGCLSKPVLIPDSCL